MRFRVSRPHKHPKSNILWFRLAVPKDVREKVGKTEIKLSLGTADSHEAQIEHARLTAEWKSRFQQLRREISAEQIARAPEIVDRFLKILSDRQHGDEDIIFYALQKMVAFHLVTAWGPEEYRARGADRAFGGNPDDDFWEDWSIDEEPDANIIPEAERDFLAARMRVLHRRPESLGAGFRDVIQHVLSSRRWEAVAAHVTLIEAFTETAIPVGSALYDAVAENFVRRLVEHVSYRWDPEVLSALAPSAVSVGNPIPAPAQTVPDQAMALASSEVLHLNQGKSGKMQLLSAGLQRWKEVKLPGRSAMVEADRAVGRFIELFGDKPVAQITDDDLYDYRDFIEAMPTNLSLPNIQASGQSLRDAVAEAWTQNPDRPKLSPASIKKDIGALSAIFTALKGERWIKVNVAAGIPVSGYSKKRKGQKYPRLPLRPTMMRDLFATPLFTGCAGKRDIERTKPGPYVFQDVLYWIFLFFPTAGPRLEEVGQILLDDIEVIEDEGKPPIVGVYVTGTGPDQSVKTDESIRVIIIHPKLIDLGFLDYVKRRRAEGATRLFDLKQSHIGTWTKGLSQRMNRYLDRTITSDKRYVFYSIRHEFSDRSEIDMPESVSRAIMGHARSRSYGLGAPLHHRAKELEKLDLSFIDWKRLKAAAGR